MPLLNTELDTPKVVGEDGVEEWWCKATHKVVGHHIDGQRFFTESLGDGKYIGIHTADVMDPQYRPVLDKKEAEKQKAIDEMFKLTKDCADASDARLTLYDAGYTKSKVKPLPKDWYNTYHNFLDDHQLSIYEWLIAEGYCIGSAD